MRRHLSLAFVIGLLFVGAYLTAQSTRGEGLLNPGDSMPPEASVFMVTAGQKVVLVGIIVALGVVVFCMGTALAVAVRLLDKGCRQALSEEYGQVTEPSRPK